MNYNEWESTALSEHQRQERRLSQSLERIRLTKSVTKRPGRIVRIINALARGTESPSRRMDAEFDTSR